MISLQYWVSSVCINRLKAAIGPLISGYDGLFDSIMTDSLNASGLNGQPLIPNLATSAFPTFPSPAPYLCHFVLATLPPQARHPFTAKVCAEFGAVQHSFYWILCCGSTPSAASEVFDLLQHGAVFFISNLLARRYTPPLSVLQSTRSCYTRYSFTTTKTVKGIMVGEPPDCKGNLENW